MKNIKTKNIPLIVLTVVYLYIVSLVLFPFYLPDKDSIVKIDDNVDEYTLTLEEQKDIIDVLRWHRWVPLGEVYFCTDTPRIIINDDISLGVDFKGDGVLYSKEKNRFLYLSSSKMKVIHNILDKYEIGYRW